MADEEASQAFEARQGMDDDLEALRHQWGIWHVESGLYLVRLCIAGEEIRGTFASHEEALAFQRTQLAERLDWPRNRPTLSFVPERHPQWDHPVELEPFKEYSFECRAPAHRGKRQVSGLTEMQLRDYNAHGFLVGLPILGMQETEVARAEFDMLLAERLENAVDNEERYKFAHTIWRPFQQALVSRLARHKQVLAIVEDILGPRFVCWSAHLFCKLPGDPTAQPWHQDAGFWPLSKSRAITVWIAFDDVDAENAAVKYVEGSHRLANLVWQPANTNHHLLSAQIPDIDLLGRTVMSVMKAGEASVHSDLTVHASEGNSSHRRRAGLALRFVAADAQCLGAMINGYRMDRGCLLPKGRRSDPSEHWKSMRRPGGGKTKAAQAVKAALFRSGSVET